MSIARSLRCIRRSEPLPAILTNAGQTKSVVGSDNNLIARAGSLLYAVERTHNGPCLTPEQARDVLAWVGQVA